MAFGGQNLGVDPELRDALEGLENKLREVGDHADTRAAGLREHIAESIAAAGAESRRHIGVVTEGLRSDFRVATEGIAALHHKFDTSQVAHEQARRRLDLLEARVTALERRRPRPRRSR